jgi:hypothetical protein
VALIHAVKTTWDRLSVGLSAFLLSSKPEKAWDRASSSFFSSLLLSSGLNNSGIGQELPGSHLCYENNSGYIKCWLSAFLLSSKPEKAWDRASSSFFSALLLSSELNNSGIG